MTATRPTLTMGVVLVLVAGCDRWASPASPLSLMTGDAHGVVSDVLGFPLAGVRVQATDGPAAGQFVVTGDDGRFLLSRASGADGVALRMTRDGFATEVILYHLSNDVQVRLWPMGSSRLEESTYAITVTADAACTALPAEFRTRTYSGVLESTGNPHSPTRRWFALTLGGAEFYPTQRVMFGSVTAGDVSFFVSSWEIATTWLDDGPIVERVGAESSLSLLGRAKTTGVSAATGTTTDLDGTMSYCPRGADNDLYFQCAVPPVGCASTRHRLTVARQ